MTTATTPAPTQAPTSTTRVAPSPTPLPAVVAAAAASPMAVPDPTPRVFGCTRICAVEYGGADNTGKTLANAGIQKAIDALPAAGGEVHLPAGTYLVDAVNYIKLRSHMWLHLDDGAEIVVQPNNQPRYRAICALGVTEVLISGGKITGDRDQHDYAKQARQSDNTHEWGMGVGIYGSTNVTVRDITINGCTGDGVMVATATVAGKPAACTGTELINVISTNNRRQAVSVVKGSDVTIINCELSHTKGTAPECGIDVEPEGDGISQNIRIFNSHLHSNNANGVLVVKRGDVACVIKNVLVTGCLIERNGACGVYGASMDGLEVFMNTIVDNGQSGTRISGAASNVHIAENTYGRNYNRGTLITKDRKDFTQIGLSKAIESDILSTAKDPSLVVVGRNNFI